MSPVAISILGEFIKPALKPWDILDVQQEMGIDLHQQTPLEFVVEGAYRAAYRSGFLVIYRIGKSQKIFKKSSEVIKSNEEL